MGTKKDKALILGAGFSGLLAAKVLSRFFKEVIVVERDPEYTPHSRPGAPQIPFSHFIVPFGLRAIEKIFPNYEMTFLHKGGRKIDLCNDISIVVGSKSAIRFKSDNYGFLIPRNLIEVSFRELIKQEPNVSILFDTEVTGLLYDYKNHRITGATVKSDNKLSNIYADLTIACLGARSDMLKWFEELELDLPPEEKIKINYTQLAYKARWPSNYNPDYLATVLRFRDFNKGGYFWRVEDDSEGKPQWLFAIVTHLREDVQKKKDDFDQICSELGDPALAKAVKEAAPLTDLELFKVPFIQRRFFSKMKKHPKDFIAMGDLQTVWAPHTALGMATAAQEALCLQELLKGGCQNLPLRYYKRTENIISRYWKLQISQHFAPITGLSKPSLYTRLLLWYKGQIGKYSWYDPVLQLALFRFTWSERQSVAYLFNPSIIFRVIYYKLFPPRM